MRICRNELATVIAALTVSAMAARGLEKPQAFGVNQTLTLGGDGRWDYVSVDAKHHLYLTRSNHTQIVDAASGKILADLAGGEGLHGVAVVPGLNRGFITDGKAGKLLVFDSSNYQSLGSLAAADDADDIVYDDQTDRVLVACGDANQMFSFQPTADPAEIRMQKINLDGKPEALVADGYGHAFVCLADKEIIADVDLTVGKVVHRWACGSGKEPTGLAINAKAGRVFAGCRNQKLVVLDTHNGKVLAELPIGQGNDACAFDPETAEAFASCGDGTVTVIHESSSGQFEVEQTIQTARGARTMTIDPSTHKLYLPTADFKPGDTSRRPAVMPGTFKVLVVGRPGEK